MMKPNDQRASIAIILIWIVLVIDVISSISSYVQIGLLERINFGEFVSDQEIDANDNREQIIGVLYLCVYVVSMITFIMWFRRAYFNLRIKKSNLSFSESSPAWSWFVPIYSLYAPYKIMEELFKKTDEILTIKGFEQRINLSTTIVGFWWGLWVLNTVLGQMIFRIQRNAETIDALISVSWMHIISTVLFIPLSVLAVTVIKRYSEAEDILIKFKSN